MAKLSKEEIEYMDFIIPGYKDFVEGKKPTVPNVEPLDDFLDGMSPEEIRPYIKRPQKIR